MILNNRFYMQIFSLYIPIGTCTYSKFKTEGLWTQCGHRYTWFPPWIGSTVELEETCRNLEFKLVLKNQIQSPWSPLIVWILCKGTTLSEAQVCSNLLGTHLGISCVTYIAYWVFKSANSFRLYCGYRFQSSQDDINL
jgi:hypothetical protein